MWLLGGGAVVVFGDWKAFSGNTLSGNKVPLAIFYSGAAVGGAFLTVLVMSVFVALTVRARATSNRYFEGRVLEFVMIYITYGYSHYADSLSKSDIEAKSASDPVRSLREFGGALANILAATSFARSSLDQQKIEIFIDQALEAIEKTVSLFAAGSADLKLKTNYMLLVGASSALPSPALFVEAGSAYEAYLVFQRYREGQQVPVCLPIEADSRSRHVLPGAPSCVTEKAACHINVDDLAFREGVPQRIRQEIGRFFETADYRSVLSVPLIWGKTVVGVVNVESSYVDIVGKGADCVESVGRALAPYCVILGELVHLSSGLSHAS